MIEYSLKCSGVRFDFVYLAYIKTIRDKLRLLYDPIYAEPERFKALQYWAYDEDYPELFDDGLNLFDFLDQIEEELKNGMLHSLGYLPLVAVYGCTSGRIHQILPGVEFPEGGTPVDLDNIGTVASERFPMVHGHDADSDGFIFLYGNGVNRAGFPYNKVLDGTLLYTAPFTIATSLFDDVLNQSNCFLLSGGGWDYVYARMKKEKNIWKRADMYMTWEQKRYVQDEETEEESTGDESGRTTGGTIGWGMRRKVDENGDPMKDENGEYIYEEYWYKFDVTLHIHTNVPFRYKYAVLAACDLSTDPNHHCPYDFYDDGTRTTYINVLYEKQSWVSGDQSVTLKFDPGSYPGEEWYVHIRGFCILVYPELPDRLTEVINGDET